MQSSTLKSISLSSAAHKAMVPDRRKKVRHFGFRWKSFQTIIKSDGNKSDEIDSIINYYIIFIDY